MYIDLFFLQNVQSTKFVVVIVLSEGCYTKIVRMLSSKDVNGWLYVLIVGSVMVTFLLTSRVLDKIALPVG